MEQQYQEMYNFESPFRLRAFTETLKIAKFTARLFFGRNNPFILKLQKKTFRNPTNSDHSKLMEKRDPKSLVYITEYDKVKNGDHITYMI